MEIKSSILLAAFLLLFSGCSSMDQKSRKDCIEFEEELYEEQVCRRNVLECEYDMSGRQMCRTGECAELVPELRTRQVCVNFVCKEGFVRHSDDNCYTPDELSRL